MYKIGGGGKGVSGGKGGVDQQLIHRFMHMLRWFRRKSSDPFLPQRTIERVGEHELRLTEVESDLKATLKRLQKLEGRFYGTLGAEASQGSAPKISRLSKAELLTQLGIRPGRPVPKIEE